ncbi:MAG TPA: tetratricopeptide repeat protein [Allosphingosinicella sp.]|nr:tetratricopeptide repeat protein [Allosphingosinicella sp.]
MKKRVLKVAASTLVMGATMVGCTSVPHYRPSLSAGATRNDRAAADYNRDAQDQLRRGNATKALALMEKAVEQSPRDAGYRMALAQLYLKSGRFVSAEATFADVLAISPGDNRAGFYLAVSKLAQGKTADALAQLQTMDADAAPADVGLAYALAGDTRRALSLLEAAAHAPTANGRVRQNLALAYALAGDWKKARLVAAQDVSPVELPKRMEQWAALAGSSASAARVASLLGITAIADDQGRPARLALAPAAPEAPATALAAAAEPAPVVPTESSQAVVAAPVEASVSAAAPVDGNVAVQPTVVTAPAEAGAPAAEPAPTAIPAVYVQAAQTLINPAPTATQRTIRASVPLFSRPKPQQRHMPGVGRFVVQLGAFSSSAQVERAWAQAARRYAFSAGQQPLSTTVRIPGKGVFHRLSIAGFDSPAKAQRLCESIKARAGVCFVRATAGDAPVQWASRYSRKA